MTTCVSSTNNASFNDALFTKLNTKQKGYIDEANLKSAAEASEADAAKMAEVFKQFDSGSDGKVTKSELSAAVEKVVNELSPQMDQSRVGKASSGATGCAGGPPQGGGAPPAQSADSESASASKYIAAADTNTDGTVSAEEAAAYKKLLASAAEAKAQTQAQEYQKTSEMSEQTDSSTFAVSA